MPTPTATVSLLILDDHRVFTDSLALSLDLEPDLRCVAVAHTVRDALAMATAIDFDVAIVDLQLPDGDGIEALAHLRRLRPGARVVVLTSHSRPDLARRAVAAGAVAFLPKGASLARIIAAVRSATADRPMVDTDRDDPIGLTPREFDVLRQLAVGRDARGVAAALGMSLYTARDHIKALMAKLDAHTQLEALIAAERRGLVTIGSRY